MTDESHALVSGRSIGPYQVLARLGAGGMGEVYRARDTKLGRDVAIKVLPAAFTSDPERLARFEREARVLAALNHPHIGAIYGFEESGDVRALVLELVEGPTLAERLAMGPLSVTEALTIARQIADALDAAHEKGIVHRDLKPANIKITPDGVVKVLDFGLAKAITGDSTGPDLSQSPTVTVGGTREGVILGTAAYMSPEQARGQAVDKRTDIWAYGCVLYEMLTGRLAFGGHTVSDTIVAILEREPAWESLPERTSLTIRRLLERCLAKDSKRRLRDIGDALDELASATARSSVVSAAPARAAGSRSKVPLIAVVALTGVLVSGVSVWVMHRLAPGSPLKSADATTQRVTFDSALTTTPTLSQDGRFLAYASDRAGRGDLDIWVQQTSGGVPLRLTDDPTDDSTPAFSPDGSQIVFRSDRGSGGVYLVSALGGPARLLVPEGRRPRFSPDGLRIAYWAGQFRGNASGITSAVFTAQLGGGAPVRLLPEFTMARDPVWSPDGRSLLILARRDRTSPLAEVFDWWWAPLDGRPPVKTGVLDLHGLRSAEPSPDVWTSTGVLFSDGQNLWSIPISETSGKPLGPIRQLTFGTGPYLYPTTARDGSIAFAALRRERVIERVALGDAKTTATPVRVYADGQPGAWRASITRDGSEVAFERAVQDRWEIWTRNVRTGQQQMLVSVESPVGLNATISQDGARVAYTVSAGKGVSARGFVVEMSGGTPRLVCSACDLHGFLSDNHRVLAEVADGRSLRLYDISNGAYEDLVRTTEGQLDRPHASTDDRWLAFRREVGTALKSFVIPLTPGRPPSSDTWAEIEEPTTTGRPAGWSLDSSTLYLLLDTDGFRCLWGQQVSAATGRLTGRPYPVRHFHGNQVATAGGVSTSFGDAMSADGFLYETMDIRGDVWKLAAASNASTNK